MVEFKLSREEGLETLTINVRDKELYIEPSFVKYIKGQLQFIKDLTKSETILKYYKHGARSLIPKLKGSGVIVFKSILGHFNILDLSIKKNQNLICEKDIFVVSEEGVQVTPKINLGLQRLLSNLPVRDYHLSGDGKIVLYSTGPIQVIELHEEKLSIYHGQVVAYSENLKISQSISNDGFWGLTKKNKTIMNFFGTGVVYIVAHHNQGYLLANRLNPH